MNPINILLTGEEGVGKTTIMNLLPGDTILQIDDDLNEILQNSVNLEGLESIILKEIDLEKLVNKSNYYKDLLDTLDIIIIVTNSAASNLKRTHQLISRLKQKIEISKCYVIANFQDKKKIAINIDKIEELFGERTYGVSAVQENSSDNIQLIIREILEDSRLDKELKEPSSTSVKEIFEPIGNLVFISYATADSDFFEISKISEKLNEYPNIDEILYWEENLKDDIYDYMNKNLGICDIFILFCSEKAAASEAVQMEWKSALKIKKPIIPVFISENDIPPLLSTKLGVAFNKDDIENSIEQIYQLINKKLENS